MMVMGERAGNDEDWDVIGVYLADFLRWSSKAKNKIIPVATMTAGWAAIMEDLNMGNSKIGKKFKDKLCKHCCRNSTAAFVILWP